MSLGLKATATNRERTYRCELGRCKGGKEAFSRLPPCFPLPRPSLLSTSRTSPGPELIALFLLLDLDRVCVSRSPPVIDDDALSSVEMEAGRASAELDMLLLPSRASLRSVTPTPRVGRVRLWRDMFSICIKAGDIFRSGETPSPRNVASKVRFSIAV